MGFLAYPLIIYFNRIVINEKFIEGPSLFFGWRNRVFLNGSNIKETKIVFNRFLTISSLSSKKEIAVPYLMFSQETIKSIKSFLYKLDTSA